MFISNTIYKNFIISVYLENNNYIAEYSNANYLHGNKFETGIYSPSKEIAITDAKRQIDILLSA